MATDVLIVGGGLCGILTAHRLREAGMHCIIVDGKRIGGGVTQNTTAKITAQHGLIYADLIQRFGLSKAKQYYDANTAAIQQYRVLAERFPCDFEEKTAHVYSTDNRQKLEREAEAYQRLGLPAHIEEAPPLPFSTVGTLAMKGQAQFHPLKLLYALSDNLEIFENTFVQTIKGNIAYTRAGKIQARQIILATHYPLVTIPGLYFLKLYQHRSYVLALKGAPLIDGMYLDERETGLSFRTYGDLLFVGGGDHKTGKQGGNYAELEAFTKKAYPQATEHYRWATQDCMSLDQVPYIGRHRAGKDNLYVATGFNKWGMTGSMVAAELLTDLILHGPVEATSPGRPPWASLFNPRRSILSKQLFVNLGAATVGLLSPGGPRCTHMGCKLHKNIVEGTWDCACYGSRFEQGGRILNNPAKRRLRR